MYFVLLLLVLADLSLFVVIDNIQNCYDKHTKTSMGFWSKGIYFIGKQTEVQREGKFLACIYFYSQLWQRKD